MPYLPAKKSPEECSSANNATKDSFKESEFAGDNPETEGDKGECRYGHPRMCIFFQTRGCKKGNNCDFFHSRHRDNNHLAADNATRGFAKPRGPLPNQQENGPSRQFRGRNHGRPITRHCFFRPEYNRNHRKIPHTETKIRTTMVQGAQNGKETLGRIQMLGVL